MAAFTTCISEGTYARLTSPDRNLYCTVGATSHSSSGAKSAVKSGKSSYLLRLAAVGLGLLCAILLMATIALCVLYTRERGLEVLNDQNCTWRDYKEHLQRDLNILRNDKAKLQGDYKRLSNERNQLQRDRTRLCNERNQLQRDYNSLSRRCQLRRDLNSQKGQCITCPEGWKQLSSKCYFFSTVRKSWEDSLQDCKLQGADLVIIRSQEEQEFINQHAKGGHHWIGLKDSANRTFEWVDGTLLQQAFWKAGSPDENRRARCVLTGPGEELWADSPCDFTWMWICETDASCV